jgi:heptaprenyl diphosphate synthase
MGAAMQTKKLVLIALYSAIALTLFVVEAMIPIPVPVPGVKLGLSNIVTLVALLFLNKRAAGMILFIRITLGALLVGVPSMLLFSGTGGIFAFVVMVIALKITSREQIWVVSILGALAHNAGQLLMAAWYLQTTAIFAYAPVLVISAIVSGVFTGLVAKNLLRYETILSWEK